MVRLSETVEGVTDKLSASIDAVLAMSDADLAEAVNAYSSIPREGHLSVAASEEDEDLFACRAALLRLHHLQLLSKAPSDVPNLYASLHKLVQVTSLLHCPCLSACVCVPADHAQLSLVE